MTRPEEKAKPRARLTIYHGFALSLGLHSSLAFPFIIPAFWSPKVEHDTIVLDMDGDVGDRQQEEKILDETKGQVKEDEVKEREAPPPKQQATAAPQSMASPTEQEQEEPSAIEKNSQPAPPKTDETPPAPTETAQKKIAAQADRSGSERDVKGADEAQIKQAFGEKTQMAAFQKNLSDKIAQNLSYPKGSQKALLKGVPKVSFTVMMDGRLRPDTLKIAKSSGQPQLDESALKTIRASAPFPIPPRELTVTIDVDYFH